MGRGDKRSKKGKIWRHSFGNSRPKPKVEQKAKRLAKAAAKKEAPKV
jgi:30S ribosomal protein S31